MKEHLSAELKAIEEAGLYKQERIITSPQKADITVEGGKEVLNFCANNYLGLSNNPRLIDAAKRAMDTHGYGMSSVRFICGTQDIHKQLEKRSPTISAPKIRFFTPPASMRTAVCSNPSSPMRTRLSPTR